MRKIHKSALSVSVSGAAIALMAVASPAVAQTVPTPAVHQPVDENGVDTSRGTFNATTVDVSIGSDALGLKYIRSNDGATNAWRDNFVGSLAFDGTTMTVSLGDSSETFTYASSAYTSDQGAGSTLTYNSSTQEYAYTHSDGTTAIFASTSTGYGRYGNAGYIKSIAFPNGLSWTFNNVTGQWCPNGYGSGSSCTTALVTAVRVQSVTNSAGYQMKLDYASDTLADYAGLDAWYRVTKATGINNATEYCNPVAPTCTLSGQWPSMTYALSGSTETDTDAQGGQRIFTFDTSGRIVSVQRPTATSPDITVTYGTNSKVSSVTNAGVAYTYNWSDNGNVRTLTIGKPDSTSRRIDSSIPYGVIYTSYDELGNYTTVIYDTNLRPQMVYATEGNYTQYTYDARGNVTETRIVSKTPGTPTDIVTTAGFDTTCTNVKTCNKPNWTKDALGNQTDYTYDSATGNLLTMTLPAASSGANRPQLRYGYSSLQAYYKNSSGSIVASGAAISLPTTVSACKTGTSCAGTADEVKTTIGYGAQTAGTANNLQPVSVTKASGDGALSVATALAYDTVGNLTTVDGPLSGSADTTAFKYDALRRKVGTISADPDGAGSLPNLAVRTTFNADGAVTLTERGSTSGQTDTAWAAFSPAESVASAYDTNGRKVSDTLKSGGQSYALIQYSYDTLGRLDCAAQRMNPTQFGSLPTSACTAQTVGSFGADRIVKNTYDATGRMTARTTGYTTNDMITEKVAFTPNGRVSYVIDGMNNRTTFEYDGFDRLVKKRLPSSTQGANSSSATDYELYGYDAVGNLLSFTKRDGSVLTYQYDNLNRMTVKVVPERTGLDVINTRDVYYGYDLLGEPTDARFGSITGKGMGYTYDALGRVTSSTENWVSTVRTLNYEYNAAGNRTKLTYPDTNYVTYEYDGLGRTTAIKRSGTATIASYTYNSLGRRSGLNGGIATSYTYDAVGRLSSLTNDLPGTTNDSAIGSIAYNPASQIVGLSRSSALAWTDSYDVDRTYTTDGLNRYSGAGSASFCFDANGNLTADGSSVYLYDVENRLVEKRAQGTGNTNCAALSYAGSLQVGLRYDVLGRLYAIAPPSGVETRLFYDGSALIGEYTDTGTLQRRYVMGAGIDSPLAWYEGSGFTSSEERLLRTDLQGSVVLITDSSASTMLGTNRYDEYGVPQSTNIGRFQYTGQAWVPEAGMSYYKARMYSPTLGRFMQTDPIGYNDGLNWYRYAGNDPVNASDPSGLCEAGGRGANGCTVPVDPIYAAMLSSGSLLSIESGQSIGQAAAANANRAAVSVSGANGVSGPSASGAGLVTVGSAEDGEVIIVNGLIRAQEIIEIPEWLRFPFFFEEPPIEIPDDPVPFPTDPTKPPGPGWVWRGRPGSKPGSPNGNWYNPKTGESLRDDLDHPPGIDPHWDYRAPDGSWWRWFGPGNMTPKSWVGPIA